MTKLTWSFATHDSRLTDEIAMVLLDKDNHSVLQVEIKLEKLLGVYDSLSFFTDTTPNFLAPLPIIMYLKEHLGDGFDERDAFKRTIELTE